MALYAYIDNRLSQAITAYAVVGGRPSEIVIAPESSYGPLETAHILPQTDALAQRGYLVYRVVFTPAAPVPPEPEPDVFTGPSWIISIPDYYTPFELTRGRTVNPWSTSP